MPPSIVAASTMALCCLTLVACDAGAVLPGGSAETPPGSSSAKPETDAGARVVINVPRGAAGVRVDKRVEVGASNAQLRSVAVTSPAGDIAGTVSEDGSTWTATQRLEPGASYVVEAVAAGADGRKVRRTSTFSTQDLNLDQQTYPSVAPLQGETVGVGMPVIVTFDVPVTDRASIERHMTVESSPQQEGTWHWRSDTEVHWRPKTYWEPSTEVSVDIDINSVSAGNGIYGQESRVIDFEIGDSVVSKVDARTYEMETFVNGELVRTTPITTGKPGFTTRSGVKVIMEKFRTRRMNSETVGIPAGSAEAYDIDNVEYAMRVTYSGEFLHAAPWSVASQGNAHVSHGCTGMSPSDAAWLYNISKRGDVVEYTGTDRPMTLGNGYGDWNASYADYARASALRSPGAK